MEKMCQALVLACLLFTSAVAQNWTTVSASNITDLNQNKLAAGQLCFMGTDQNDNPISFNIGGGGQSLRRAYCAGVTNGAVTSFTVPNPVNTTPSGIYYRVTTKDSSTGQEVLRYTQVTFSGGTFNFDNYAPSNVGSFNPPIGTATPGNLTVNGNLSVTGSLSGSITCGQLPALTGDATSLAGSCALTLATVGLGKGGTGATTAAAAFNALSPMTTLGDIEYESGGNTASRLAGNTSTTKKYLSQTGNGTVSAIPAWVQPSAADLSNGTTGTAGSTVVLATSPSISSPTLTGTTSAGRLSPSGTAPTSCSITGAGTSPSCVIVGSSTDSWGGLEITTGTGSPSASGTITLIFSSALGPSRALCQFQAQNTNANWNARVSFLQVSIVNTSNTQTWDNNGTALGASAVYDMNYRCHGN
jgi:hypothetical protein